MILKNDYLKVRQCIALLNSMVHSGELHSETSAKIVSESLSILDSLPMVSEPKKLKPIEEITEEHLRELAKIEGLMGFIKSRSKKNEFTIIKESDSQYSPQLFIYDDFEKCEWNDGMNWGNFRKLGVKSYQYLQSRGYQLPVYFPVPEQLEQPVQEEELKYQDLIELGFKKVNGYYELDLPHRFTLIEGDKNGFLEVFELNHETFRFQTRESVERFIAITKAEAHLKK